MKLLLVTLLVCLTLCQCAVEEEAAGAEYLQRVNKILARHDKADTEAKWAYSVNKTDENLRRTDEVQTKYVKYLKKVSKDIVKFNWRSYSNDDTRRQFKILSKTVYEGFLKDKGQCKGKGMGRGNGKSKHNDNDNEPDKDTNNDNDNEQDKDTNNDNDNDSDNDNDNDNDSDNDNDNDNDNDSDNDVDFDFDIDIGKDKGKDKANDKGKGKRKCIRRVKEFKVADVLVCDYKDKNKCDLSLESEINDVMSSSRDPKELEYYWTEFHNKAATPIRSSFERYIELNTEAAKLNNLGSGAEFLLDEHEDEDFEDQLEDVVEDIKPLYTQIQSYVRYHLRQQYGDEVVSENGSLPMHLLGSMWANRWHIDDIILPFPDNYFPDVSEEIVAQGYTPLKMYKMVDEIFQSMGLQKLPQNFWDKSRLEASVDGGDMDCTNTIWDFSVDDVRLTTCASATPYDFSFIHMNMGLLQHTMQYQTQPFIYRHNSDFQLAVGKTFFMSATTNRHLENVGLLKNHTNDEETHINELFLTALDVLIPLHNVFIMNKYRLALLRGQIEKPKWNCAFWKLREEYMGIKPPVVRSEDSFDAPAQNDDIADLVSVIIRFQLYKSACIKAGQYDASNPALPLDNCDFYGSPEVGEAFNKMLSLGNSKPLSDLLEAFTGERKLDGKAIAEYFEPLRVWLHDENVKNEAHVGWTRSDKCISA